MPIGAPASALCAASGIRTENDRSAFRELGSAASAPETVLLAFLHARIARQMAAVAKRLERLGVIADQRSSDPHAARAGLPRRAPAGDANDDVDVTPAIDHVQRLDRPGSILFVRKIHFQVAAA